MTDKPDADSLVARIREALVTTPIQRVAEDPEALADYDTAKFDRHDVHNYTSDCAWCRGEADTLAAAVLAVVQPELAQAKLEADKGWEAAAKLEAGCEYLEADRNHLRAERGHLTAERDQLAAAVQAVRELHEPNSGDCGTCADETGQAARWPCDTISALDINIWPVADQAPGV